MLGVFAIAFGALFRDAAFAPDLPHRPFVLPVFCGLIVFGLFSEVLTRSPTIVVGNPNYVKKVVFPIEILPPMILGSSIIHATIGIGILCIGQLALGYGLPWTVVLVPVVLLPLVILALGLSWFLASLGVYLRDLNHSMSVISQALFFLSPIVYPFSLIEKGSSAVAAVLALNPIKVAIDSMRLVVIWGEQPEWTGLLITGAVGIVFAWLGYVWFHKTRRGFADVI